MLTHGEFWILEAAFRSLLMAVAVWAGIRLLRVRAVLAEKVAWVLVLLAAGTMPLVMHNSWLAIDKAFQISFRSFASENQKPAPQPAVNVTPPPAPGAARSELAAKPSPVRASTLNPRHSVVRLQPVRRRKPVTQTFSGSPAASAISAIQPVAPAPKPKTAARTALPSWTQVKELLAFTYLAITGILLLRTLAGLAVAFRIWRSAKSVENFAELSNSADASLKIRASSTLQAPVTIGSTVILPADYAQWDAAKLRVVLAHEQSHVRQRDFYLQLLAAIYAAVFWFSPLGWWLQRKLSALGEALSDRAGLEQAANPASYACILLEFAAKSPSHSFSRPLAGVAMARRSNLSSRIERILNARLFRLSFHGGRRHAIFAATLVPAALIAVVACIRIVPAVEAAQDRSASTSRSLSGGPGSATSSSGASSSLGRGAASGTLGGGQASGTGSGSASVSGSMPNQSFDVGTGMNFAQAAPAPAPFPAPAPDVVAPQAPEAPEAPEIQAPEPPEPPDMSDDGQDAYAIVQENADKTIRMNGEYNDEFAKVRKRMHGDYIWFERDGKSYVITDPAIVAQGRSLFKGNDALQRMQAQLDMKQKELDKKMADLKPELMHLDSPEFKAEMDKFNSPEFQAKLNALTAQIAKLQTEKFKKITDDMSKEFSEAKLDELTGRMADLQVQLGEMQGRIQEKIGERQALMGEKQGEIGEQMGKLGEEMGRIGEQEGRIAEEASRKLKSIIDQAIKDGKAKPAE
jgi:beta-lactamase regulating signal transducer with metallopeptidase domain